MAVPEVDVLGNSVSIVDGDTTPDVADHTSFPTTTVSASSTRTFTIQNTGSGPLSFSGLASSDPAFTIVGSPVSPIAPSGSVTFDVVFTPTAAGLVTSTISFTNDDSDENPYNFDVSGTGFVAPSVKINELRVSHSTLDNNTGGGSNNFVEVYETNGTGGVSLSGLTLLIVSSSSGFVGNVDFAVDLAPATTDDEGFVLIADDGTTAAYSLSEDIILSDFDLFGSPSTFLIVSGFTGTAGSDLDSNDDGIFDTTPWSTILDSVSIDTDSDAAPDFSATVVLSADTFVPSGIRRLVDGTGSYGTMDFTSTALDTPGYTNVLPPGVLVVESGGATAIAEGGATDSFTVVLNTQPTDDVTVTITPDAQSDLGLGSGVAITKTFTNLDWNIPQNVVVTAVDDLVNEGSHSSTITFSASSQRSDLRRYRDCQCRSDGG